MIALSRALDVPMRALVRRKLRGDRASHPTQTALIVVNPAGLAALAPEAIAALRDVAAAMRVAGSAVIVARCAGALDGDAVFPHDVAVTTAARSALRHTDLDATLRARGVERLIVAGFPTNLDVDSTVRHAVELDYHVTVLADASTAVVADDHVASIEVTFPRICHAVTTSGSLLRTALQRIRRTP